MFQKLMVYLARSPITVLCVMTVSFLAFGYFSINLFLLFKANIDAINAYGFMVLKEGAAIQLLGLLANAFISVFFYSIWKVCERLVVDWTMNGKVRAKARKAKNKIRKNGKKNIKEKSNEVLDSEVG